MSGNEEGPTAEEAATRLGRLLEHIAQDVGAHIGVIYLLVPERQVLQMIAVVGAPKRLVWPWVLVPVLRSIPGCTQPPRASGPSAAPAPAGCPIVEHGDCS